MKRILYLLLAIFFFVGINETFALNINADTTTQNKLILANDSGFINLKEGLDFLLANSLIDTSWCVKFWLLDNPDTIQNVSFWDLCNPTDTIAKYYRKDNSDLYIMCVFDCPMMAFPKYRIIEINSEGKLIKMEEFWDACLINNYSCFSKYGVFFGIKTCRIFIGAFNHYLFLFKDVTPQDSIYPICLEHFEDGYYNNSLFKSSSSKIEFIKDNLIVHYTIEIYKRPVWLNKKPRTKKITIKYFYENGQWKTMEMNKLKKIMGYKKP